MMEKESSVVHTSVLIVWLLRCHERVKNPWKLFPFSI